MKSSGFFSSKFDFVSFIAYIAKTASKKLGGFICFMTFLSFFYASALSLEILAI